MLLQDLDSQVGQIPQSSNLGESLNRHFQGERTLLVGFHCDVIYCNQTWRGMQHGELAWESVCNEWV